MKNWVNRRTVVAFVAIAFVAFTIFAIRRGRQPVVASPSERLHIPAGVVLNDESFEDAPWRVLLRQIWYQQGPVKRLDVELAIHAIYQTARERRGPKTNRQVTSYVGFLYNSRENAVTGGFNWLARVHWRADGGEPEFEFHDDIIQASTRTPIVVAGRPEALRRAIYRSMAEADRRATAESKAGLDLSNVEHAKISMERWPLLRDKYKEEVRRRYNISQQEAAEIVNEAYENGWDNGGF